MTNDAAAELARSLHALGLKETEALVLEHVLRVEQTTSREIAAVLQVDASTVSRALARLEVRGIVELLHSRRPAVVSVALGIDAAVQGLVVDRRRELDLEEERVAVAVHDFEAATAVLLGESGLLRDAVRRREQRGEPAVTLEQEDVFGVRVVERYGKHSHDEVLPLWLPGTALNLRCAARLIVVGDRVDPWALQRLPAGTEVRRATTDLPPVKVLDGQRVGVRGSGRYGAVGAWSADPAHVAAAQQLFALWWDAAEPVRVVEAKPFDWTVDPGMEED